MPIISKGPTTVSGGIIVSSNSNSSNSNNTHYYYPKISEKKGIYVPAFCEVPQLPLGSLNALQGPRGGVYQLAQGTQSHTWSQGGVNLTGIGKGISVRKGKWSNGFQGANGHPLTEY